MGVPHALQDGLMGGGLLAEMEGGILLAQALRVGMSLAESAFVFGSTATA